MKTFEDPCEPIDGRAIDRLVDGDLPEAERRAMLLRLDADPDAWRRCALAFLEDQTWRKALSPIAVSSAPISVPIAPTRTASGRLRRLAFAATVLASTFAGGFATGGLGRVGPVIGVAKDQPAAAIPTEVALSGEVVEVGSLQFVDSSAGELPPDQFPIRSGRGLDDEWLRSQPPSVPDYVRARLERQGYQVLERRNLVSVEVGEGKHVSIPVDQVEVDYVGQQPL
jgi:hypothetical protein